MRHSPLWRLPPGSRCRLPPTGGGIRRWRPHRGATGGVTAAAATARATPPGARRRSTGGRGSNGVGIWAAASSRPPPIATLPPPPVASMLRVAAPAGSWGEKRAAAGPAGPRVAKRRGPHRAAAAAAGAAPPPRGGGGREQRVGGATARPDGPGRPLPTATALATSAACAPHHERSTTHSRALAAPAVGGGCGRPRRAASPRRPFLCASRPRRRRRATLQGGNGPIATRCAHVWVPGGRTTARGGRPSVAAAARLPPHPAPASRHQDRAV